MFEYFFRKIHMILGKVGTMGYDNLFSPSCYKALKVDGPEEKILNNFRNALRR